jgi:fructokinase
MRIGIDLGGTKIEGILLGDGGETRDRRRVPTPREGYSATLDAMAALVADLERGGAAYTSVGVGIPGAISPATGLVKNANSTWLNGRALQADLEDRIGRPVRLANDANCFALSEATDGAAAGARTVFGAILGTGVGGGIVVDGRVLPGANAIAGEWGHNPLPWPRADETPGPACWCGRTGCIERWLSGPGLEADHARRTGRKESAAAIARDPLGGERLDAYANRLARALAAVINLLDPEVIVLGGGLSNIARLYDEVPAAWGAWVFSDRVDTRLCPPLHGDSSGVRGAAWLWP